MSKAQDRARRHLRPAALALAFAVALALGGCNTRGGEGETAPEGGRRADGSGGAKKSEGHRESEAITLSTEEAERAGVKVETLRARTWNEGIVLTATIRPDADRLARVAPRIAGRIVAAPAKLGHRVVASQILATLDSVEVGEAHAAWVQAQAELRIAEVDFKRAESLAADEIIARKDFLRAQSDRDKAAATLRAVAHKLHLLRGSAITEGGSVSAFAVTAPFGGTVIEKRATLGELGSPGETMFTIADLARVWIQADLPEAALAKLRVGAAARVSVPAYPSESFSGRVDYIGTSLDKDSRTVGARIVVPNADGRLKLEMFATATIDTDGPSGDARRPVLALPDAAIVLMQGQPAVFVYEQGAYEMRVIEPGERGGGQTVVKAGLKEGEQVVIAGAYALKARKLKSQLGHGH